MVAVKCSCRGGERTLLDRAQSIATVNRSQLAPWRGFGYSAAYSRFYWGMRLVLWCGPDGCVRDFDLVPANAGEREAVLELLERHPPAGQLVIADKGFAGADFEQAVAELGGLLLRPSRANEPERSSPPIGRIRQRIESIVNSLKDSSAWSAISREPRTDWSAASPRASSPSPRPSTSTGSSACHREP